MKKVVRVGVLNNFNCTDKEFKQLDGFAKKNPDCYFFINCNVNTPNLAAINSHQYQAVITVNPNITDYANVFKLCAVRKEKIAFVRVKYVPKNQNIVNLISFLDSLDIPVVITMQRFNSKKTVAEYGIENYAFSYNRYRLTEDNKKVVELLADNKRNVYICDRKGLGCEGCGLCATLNVGQQIPIYSLNLSKSGICPYNCIDCYAKAMQKFTVGCGYKAINFDVIKKNSKQRGNTLHIKHNLQVSKEVSYGKTQKAR